MIIDNNNGELTIKVNDVVSGQSYGVKIIGPHQVTTSPGGVDILMDNYLFNDLFHSLYEIHKMMCHLKGDRVLPLNDKESD